MTNTECVVCGDPINPESQTNDTHPDCWRTCPCPTPWDGTKRPTSGHHCVECHRNFSSHESSKPHRPRPPGSSVLDRIYCVDPAAIRHWQTDRPLYTPVEAGVRMWVWRLNPAAAARPGGGS